MQNIPQQLIASVANAPQILQNFATALGATPPAAPATPGITFPGLTPAAGAHPASSPLGDPRTRLDPRADRTGGTGGSGLTGYPRAQLDPWADSSGGPGRPGGSGHPRD